MIKKNGQALITLLVFVAIFLIIGMASIIMMIVNSQTSAKFEQSVVTLHIAESGAENAILQLLRNPNYIGETLPVGTGNTTITVTDIGGNQKKIISVGKDGNFLRTLQVIISDSGNILTIVSWKEV